MVKYWRREKYLFDTNSLIYASETWDEGYKRAVHWAKTKNRSPLLYLARRRYGESIVRHIIDRCALGYAECVTPEIVVEEIRKTREEDLRNRTLDLIALANIRIESMNITPQEIISQMPYKFRREIESYIEEAKKRGRKVGIDMSADPYLLYLAYKQGYTLVTTDRKLADLATRLGIEVIYPVTKEIRIEEAKYRPRTRIKPIYARPYT